VEAKQTPTRAETKWKQSPSQAEVKAKEELCSKAKHDRPVQVRLFRYMKLKAEKPAPISHLALRLLPIMK
jgi:hypothetical protein